MEQVTEAIKLNLSRNELLAALQMVSGAVEKRQTLPILSHVLLHFSDKMLLVTATDLEVELVARVELEGAVDQAFDITVPARKMIDICRALPDGAELKMTLEGSRLSVRSGSSRFVLSTLPAAEFPKVGKSDAFVDLAIPQVVLKHLIEKTYFTMAQQDVRYYLNGMLFDLNKDTLQLVATDGHRMALSAYSDKFGFKHHTQVIVPRKGVLELMRLLEDSDETITLTIGSNHIHAETDQFIFTSKLIDGKFPDFNRVIPKNTSKIVTIERSVIKEALSRAAILCNEKYRGVRLLFNNGELCITANNTEQEEAEERVSIDYNDEKLDVGFNVTYLLDVLNSFVDGEVRFMLSDGNSGVLIEHGEEKGSLYVVMPMRL